jgi:hypothetical protein
MKRRAALAAVLAANAILAVLAGGQPDPGVSIRFTDATRQSRIAFQHLNGASPVKHLVETMGSGGLFFDYDNDGWIDIFLVDGGSLISPAIAARARHRLYRNRRDGTFDDTTARSGIRHSAYGQGACAGDVDNDGFVDLYITNFGANLLYRNRGDGTFADVTGRAGVGETRWSASCAFADLDRDGDLDLFVVNYVNATAQHNPFCGNARLGTRFYCHPLNYDSLPNTLYRNDGRGTFTDVSAVSGIVSHRGNGLGVVIVDTDGDSWPDIVVANDSVANSLFRNVTGRQGANTAGVKEPEATGPKGPVLRFEESALAAGIAVATDGQARAGMGIDAGDYDGDGRADLIVTNLDFETHSLFRNLGGGLFRYATSESGIGFATLPFVGFGVAFLDADNDAALDLAVANGHLMENAPTLRAGATYAQRNLLFRNVGSRRFTEVGRSAGDGFALEKVSRGLAAGDIDNDGDLDLLVTNNGQGADLLRNDGAGGGALLVRLLTPDGRRDAIGATLRVTAGSSTQVRSVQAGSSYLSQSDTRLHVGLGGAAGLQRVDVQWPTGRTETIAGLEPNQRVTIREGAGVVARAPLAR